LPKGGKTLHRLPYIGICRYIKADVNIVGQLPLDGIRISRRPIF
jgi:hypothetical protein